MYVFIDTETTGLKCESERIVEIAAILCDSYGNELEYFQELINPDRPIPRDATAIHGITDEMVAGAPFFHQVVADLFPAWLNSDEGLIGMIAHNAEFDVGFLREEFKYAMKPMFPHIVYCSYEMAKQCYPRHVARHNHKLGTLASKFGIDPAGAHRALADCRLCKGVFFGMKKLFPHIIRI